MSTSMITALPPSGVDRIAFIQCANATFESVLLRMEPANEIAIRKLWNVEHYVDSFLRDDMLPMERGEALGLIEAFLVHHVLDLIETADDIGSSPIH
ncbi:MAG: hypothetical protein KF779_10320 [Hyphomonadaceae bacterium]|nr:hypothetical protein [Hyphomonadaceae bacterium]